MNRIKKGLFILIAGFWVACFSNCGPFEFDGLNRNTYHRVGLVNRSAHPVFVELVTQSQLIKDSGTEVEMVDTLYRVQSYNSRNLYRLEIPNARLEQFTVDEVMGNISHLRIYRVVSGDTLDARLEPTDHTNWDIFTDEGWYSYSTRHIYNLYVRESHFE